MASASMNSTLAGDVPLDRLPLQILETFFPGFGFVSRFFAAFFGIDLTSLLYSSFLVVGLIVGARWSWGQLWILKEDWFTSSITITSNDKLFSEVMDYLSKIVMEKSRTRYLAAISKNNSWAAREYPFYYSDPDKQDDSDDDDDYSLEHSDATSGSASNKIAVPRKSDLHFGPALGSHWFWHQGRYFSFSRDIEGEKQGIVLKSSKENIVISCLGRSTEPIKRLLQDCQNLARRADENKMKVRMSCGYCWGSTYRRVPRPLDTIYMDQAIKQGVIKDMKRFLTPDQARLYRRRGIPYRRGYLFHGPPGTGKTSLVSALAGHLHLELHILNLMDQRMDEDSLVEMFQSLPRRSIVLIEDIDTIGLKRRVLPRDYEGDDDDAKPEVKADEAKAGESTEKKDEDAEAKVTNGPAPKKFSLSGLLNVIDGVASQEGRILILTSNNPEVLDAALVRPGRIDKQIHLGYMNRTSAMEMFMRIYENDPLSISHTPEKSSKAPSRNSSSTSLSWDMASDVELERLASRFGDALPDGKLSPAEVQGFLLANEDEPRKAVDEVAAWAEDVIKAREQGKNIVKKDKS